MIIRIDLFSNENSVIGISSLRDLSGLKYADDVVLMSEDQSKFQVFFYFLNDGVGISGIRFAPS